jgi:hypothetical protein
MSLFTVPRGKPSWVAISDWDMSDQKANSTTDLARSGNVATALLTSMRSASWSTWSATAADVSVSGRSATGAGTRSDERNASTTRNFVIPISQPGSVPADGSKRARDLHALTNTSWTQSDAASRSFNRRRQYVNTIGPNCSHAKRRAVSSPATHAAVAAASARACGSSTASDTTTRYRHGRARRGKEPRCAGAVEVCIALDFVAGGPRGCTASDRGVAPELEWDKSSPNEETVP